MELKEDPVKWQRRTGQERKNKAKNMNSGGNDGDTLLVQHQVISQYSRPRRSLFTVQSV